MAFKDAIDVALDIFSFATASVGIVCALRGKYAAAAFCMAYAAWLKI